MRIFSAFLAIMVVAILFMLPITEAVYDFRTYLKNDVFTITTPAAVTAANVTLNKALYANDTSTITFFSGSSLDVPILTSYNATTHQLGVSGLSANLTRSMDISYDVDALNASPAVNILVDKVAWIWLLCVIAFAPAALAAIFTGRA